MEIAYNCKGCRLIGKEENCLIVQFDRIDECPCINCLVKVMCKGLCEERHNKRRRIQVDNLQGGWLKDNI